MSHYGGGSYPPRQSVDAYRASPVLGPHRGLSGGRGRGGRGRGYPPGFAPPGYSAEQQAGPELYGFQFAAGLPGFEGAVSDAVVGAGHGLAPASSEPAPEARYLAALCHESLADFQESHAWDPQVAAAVETVLRTMATLSTPSSRELNMRLQAMARLKDLAQSGIAFCVGLDLEPYGSFVSGLYTPYGDLDLSIEGAATWRDERGRVQRVTVDGMERDQQVKFLRALASRIQAKRLCLGQVDRILHARVPILKFRDVSGLDFDVGIGGSQALFKSTMLGLLAQYEWRFGALVRLVKLWARHHDVNDSTNGSLNSFALTLLVVFHLQTRHPAVLPPLCQLCGGAPGDPRPMQEGRFPDWHLLSVACDRLSAVSRSGGPGPSGGNSETLLELLASFFALYQGLLDGGWAEPKGADASALRGVLRRVRVDTWSGRLRYQRWDREGYCMSIEDPFDSTDNCARTVRREDKVAQIAGAVARGRQLLLELEQPHLAERALEGLFGPGAMHPCHLHDLVHDRLAPAVQWIRPVDLVIPPRIQAHTEGRIPHPVHVDHQRRRGGSVARGFPEQPQQQDVQRVAQQLGRLELNGQPHHGLPPPPGLGLVGVLGGLPPGAPVPGVHPPSAAVASLQHLRALMEPEVSEEAARLAELERQAAEQAAALQAARTERRAAKKAQQQAEQAAKRAERERQKAARGRSKSRSHSRSRGSKSKSRSRSLSACGRSSSLSAAAAAAAAALGNLGRPSSMATTAGGSSRIMSSSLASSSTAGVAAAAGVALSVSLTAANLAAADAAAFNAAADALSADSFGAGAVEQATEPAAAGRVAALAAAEAAGTLSDGSGGSGRKSRFGRDQKEAAKLRKQRRAAVGSSSSEPAAAMRAAAPPLPPALGNHHHHQQPDGKQGRGRGRRGRNPKPAAPGRDAVSASPGGEGGSGPRSRAGGARVLVVQRPGGAPPPPPPPPA